MRIKILTISVIIFLTLSGIAQSSPYEEINNQVWIPFMKTFSSLDADGFMALHCKDVIRMDLAGGNKYNYKEYAENQKTGNDYYIKTRNRRSLELRFEHRSVKDSFAYEIGYYKSSSFEEGDQKRHDYYGKFNTILKKENGFWKILLDADHGGVSESEFLKAEKI